MNVSHGYMSKSNSMGYIICHISPFPFIVPLPFRERNREFEITVGPFSTFPLTFLVPLPFRDGKGVCKVMNSH